MQNTSETPNRPNFGSRLGRTISAVLGVVLRVLFVIVLGVLLAVGIYFGVPWAYARVVEPVQVGLLKLDLLEARLDESNTGWEARLAALEQRVDDLDADVQAQGERIAILETGLEQANQAQAAQQAELDEHRTALDELSSAQGAIAEDYASVGQLDEVEAGLRDEIDQLSEQAASAQQVVEQVVTLRYGLALQQARGELVKAYLDLSEGNAGDAESSLALALGHLAQAAQFAPEGDLESLSTIEADLVRTAGRVRDQPVVAAQTLRSAWYELGALVP